MKHFAVLFALVALGLFGSATPGFAQAANSQIHVVVFGPPDGLPVEGATVEIDGAQLKANRDGAVWLNVAAGTYSIRISHESMSDARVDDVEVAAGEGAEVVVEVRADGEVIADVETVELGEGRAAELAEKVEANGPPGTLTGTIVSFEGQQPVEGARVFVRGLSEEATSDENGQFSMQVPAGTWDISVIHSEYSTASQTGVEVKPEQETSTTVAMTPASVRLDAFTVTIPRIEGGTIALLEERKETSQVADVIGAEQFSRSGDSNAAAALGRVTGLTVVDGKYVYVRGLGERYSSSLLNGSSLPSPDPERRVVPLDLFPTSILESVVVQKTYSADMPGGFGGGAIRMRSRSFPSEFTAGVDLSVGADTLTTFQDGQTYQGGSLDWLGFDDGTRALPERVRRAAAQSPLKEKGRFSSDGYSSEELEAIGEAMPSRYNTTRQNLMPDIGVSAHIGDTTEVLDLDMGYRFALSYDNGRERDVWHKDFYPNATLEPSNQFDFEELDHEITLSAMFAGGVEFDENNKLELTSILSRLTNDNVQSYGGRYPDAPGGQVRVTQLQWLERQLMFHQLRGNHLLDGLGDTEIGWRYAFGQARRDEPDRRTYRYDWYSNHDAWLFSDSADGNTRLYGDLVDNSHDLGVYATVPFDVWSSLEAKLKVGADFMYKDREVSTRRFAFKAGTTPSAELRSRGLDEILNEEHISDEGYQIVEVTRPTDNYTASHTIIAPYALAEVPLSKTVEMAAGVRLENSTQEVITRKLFETDDSGESAIDAAYLDTLDILPSASLTWKFREDMQLRGALARTVNRPNFRELSPACFDSHIGGAQTCGNPDLERAQITHVDTRWEWYPSRGESVSVGAFYKSFDKPIELVLVTGATPQQEFQNALGATNYGLEFDARKTLDVLSENLRDFYVAANVALIVSQIELDTGKQEVAVDPTRPLQGQSPYVVNMQFGYENADLGTVATFLYNVYGARIAEVGTYGRADTYEAPSHLVDFTLSQRLSDSFKLGFKAKNILDLQQPTTVAQKTSINQFEGRSFSLKVAWEY